MLRKVSFLISSLFLIRMADAAVVQVSDSTIQAGMTVEWKTGDTVFLNGKVFVDSGAVLKIQPGVVVKGKASATDPAALYICRNAKIFAEGTDSTPVIFTAEADTNTLTYDSTSSVTRQSFGLWGGVVILGNAKINQPGGKNSFLPFGTPDPRSIYGGSNDSDSSGTLSFVSIRYAGYAPNGGTQSEYGGLNLCGVGKGTNIHHVEVINSKADGIKIMGGSVNLKYCASVLTRGNCLDVSSGYHGKCQYLLFLYDHDQSSLNENYAVRHADSVAIGDPAPIFSNISLLSTLKNDNARSIIFENNTCVKFYNCLFYNLLSMLAADETAYTISAKNIIVANSQFDMRFYPPPIMWSDFAAQQQVLDMFYTNGCNKDSIKVKLIPYTDIIPKRIWDIVPDEGKRIDQGTFDVSTLDPFFEKNSYKGAFFPHRDSMPWVTGWSTLDKYGYLIPPPVPILTRTQNTEKAQKQFLVANRIGNSLVITLNKQVNTDQVRLEMFDLKGRRCDYLKETFANTITISLKNRNLGNGYYVCRIAAGKNSASIPFTIVR